MEVVVHCGLAPFALAIVAATLSNTIPIGIVYILTCIGTFIGFGTDGLLNYIITSAVFLNNDMSDMLNNFTKIINNQEMPDNIKNILNSMNNNTNNTSNNSNINSNNNSQNSNQNSSSNNPFGDFDMNTILKMQKIMSSMNNDKQADYRTNLLMSLKPYLKESRKGKVDQYVQLMKMGKIFEIMNPLGGDNKHV